MASLSNDPPKKKDQKMLYAGVFVVVALIVVVAAGTAVYLYMDDQYKQKMAHLASLRQEFSDQLNATNASYAQITAYQAPPNKNYLDEYRAWIDGYALRADNYSENVDRLLADQATYRLAIESDDGDYANMTRDCNRANDTVRALNDTIKGFEAEFQTRLGMKNTASENYGAALASANGFYAAAWNRMHNETSYVGSGFYHDYLKSCQQNITTYNQSIDLVKAAGAIYQDYLKGTDYYAINDTVSRMRGNVTKLETRYKELLVNIPNATVTLYDLNTAFNGAGQLTMVQNFHVFNNNFPWQISDVVVRFQLVDKATGTVRSTADVSVEMATTMGVSRYIYQAVMNCDLYHEYDVRYTLTYEY